MTTHLHNPEGVFPPYRNYSHAVEIKGHSSLLFISGLNGYHSNGIDMPDRFEDQAELIWKHIGTILRFRRYELSKYCFTSFLSGRPVL
ncbi:hypothetical protein Q4E93_31750 [Flavitalea sp. BT771]|uniref:RidA family protein n=1 Tax=Flavitalea sp. BT771 TaxID=3063329 RepID=UPI0026E2182B|nr:hypothetical protein [Flavitalea sp. BT771]MDO6435234.1 hypothetical protein [Flavitalea sp. BT771]MDV6224061.1 hypothetical protein [Flavitalea sp. BT771]